MEIRCGSCNKLFRISDDRIIGKGIKFACTRCGETIKITREEFEAYTLSRTAASAPETPEMPAMPAAPALPAVEKKAVEAPVAGQQDAVPAAPSVPDIVLNEDFPPVHEPAPARGPEPKPPAAAPKTEPRGASEPKPDIARPAVPQHDASAMPSSPHREPAHHAPQTAERSIRTSPPRSRNMLPLVLVILVMIGLAGYGVFLYIQMDAQKAIEQPREESSTEGLQIVSATGAIEPNGDLLITSVVENSMAKERPVWYVVVDIFGIQGALLSRIRIVNGKQLFTQRDYDILASRGLNVQELKAKNLEDQGIVVPPRGSVSFEIRYVQPQGAVTSFNATVQPFDPIRLFKEISGEIK
jgi:predicted Zn finger-like uncharacterized protein